METGAIITREQLIGLLEETISELKRNASFEGRIQYTCMPEVCEKDQFVVAAFVRTDNDMGQGGSMVIHGETSMEYGPPPGELVQSVHEQVLEFHQKIGQPIVEKPAVPSDERIRLRARLVSEETIEFLESLFGGDAGPIRSHVEHLINTSVVKVDFPAAVDALADIDYVVEGSRIEFGVDGGPIAAEVHRANMEKQGGPRREDGKVLKPEGWKPPAIERELVRQGWEP